MIEKLWRDVKVGDRFIDGSTVIDVLPVQMKKCYSVYVENKETEEIYKTVLSEDHMVKIFNFDNEILDLLERTNIHKRNLNIEEPGWICIEDLYTILPFSKDIYMDPSHNNILITVSVYDNGEPQETNCVTTDTGQYVINGIINHNCAKLMFYGMSSIQVYDDCGSNHKDVLSCESPEGNICEKCAHSVHGGDYVKAGNMIGSRISTNMSEPLTQLSMKHMHLAVHDQISGTDHSNQIMNTLNGFASSPVIMDVKNAKTTEEARKALYEGLKNQYKEAGIAMDDFNIQVVARKMTSYVRDDAGLRPVNPGEKCSVTTLASMGNYNNIFKTGQLRTSYNNLTRPQTQKINRDSANYMLG